MTERRMPPPRREIFDGQTTADDWKRAAMAERAYADFISKVAMENECDLILERTNVYRMRLASQRVLDELALLGVLPMPRRDGMEDLQTALVELKDALAGEAGR